LHDHRSSIVHDEAEDLVGAAFGKLHHGHVMLCANAASREFLKSGDIEFFVALLESNLLILKPSARGEVERVYIFWVWRSIYR
jgi:hypothetical protein